MQPATWRSRVGAAVQLVAAFAALSAPPVLLVAVIGNPLPAWPVDWTRVVEDVRAGLIPSSVWVSVLAVTAWAVWTVLVGMLAVEVVAVARNRPSPTGVPGWIRHLAQALVAAVIALAGPGQQALALSGAGGAPAVVAAAPAVETDVESSFDTQRVAKGRLVRVAEEDSWGGFAAEVLGDASLGPELRAANLGRDVGDGHRISESTAFVEPGWRLLIPAHVDRGRGAPADDDTQRAAADQDDVAPATWEVEQGEHFWGVAEATLAESWGRAPTEAEVVPYWQQVVEANRDGLLPPGDPDLIHPGQRFVVPAPPPDPNAPSAEVEPTGSLDSDPDVRQVEREPEMRTPEADRSQATLDADAQAPPAPSGWRAAIEGHDVADDPTPAPELRDGWRAAVERDNSTSVDADPSSDPDEPARTALGVPAGVAAGLAASSVLAAGVIGTLRWRRRTRLQQRAPGMRLPTPLPETEAQVAKLGAVAVPDDTLDDLASLLASIPLDVHPALVRATDDGYVTLLFDDQVALPNPPPPWTLADDGTDGPVGWQTRLGDRGPELSFGLPLLVTLGRAGTSTVLANVGAMGTLSLTGSPPEVRRRLRAMSLDLATSRISVPVEVAIAGDQRLASLDRARHIDDPASEVELALAEVGEVVIDDRTPRLLVCHQDTTAPDVPEELRGMVGVATAGGATGGAWVLDVEDEHTGRLRLPDGGTVRLALPDIDPDLLDDELARLDEPGSLHAVQPPRQVVLPDVDPSTNGDALHQPASATEPPWCEIRLLGPVEVVLNGARVDGLTPRTLEILTYLATHPHGVTSERLDDAVWAGAAARPGSQRVTAALTKLRKVLGDGPDGRPLVPRRSADEPIVLSEHVGTDLDRASAHLAIARDLPAELRTREQAAALDLVRGEPLEGRPYSWATDICQQAIVQLQDAALELARACREAGDLDGADRAIGQGLKLLDSNGWLYLERAHVARLRGRPEQLPRIFEQYRRKLADDADEIAGTVAIPPPEIELAFRELMAPA